MEKQKCKRCNKEKWVWKDGMCSKCHEELDQERIKKDFDEATEEGEDFDTFSDKYVICPYCGYAIPTDYGYEDFPEIYIEGDNDVTCPECEKDFVLETSISYYYETKKKEGK